MTARITDLKTKAVEFSLHPGYNEYMLDITGPSWLIRRLCRANNLPVTVYRDEIKTMKG